MKVSVEIKDDKIFYSYCIGKTKDNGGTKMTKLKNKDNGLKPLNSVIQICPKCGKVDVYKDDGHECDANYQQQRESNYW